MMQLHQMEFDIRVQKHRSSMSNGVAENSLQAPFSMFTNTFDRSRSSLGRHGDVGWQIAPGLQETLAVSTLYFHNDEWIFLPWSSSKTGNCGRNKREKIHPDQAKDVSDKDPTIELRDRKRKPMEFEVGDRVMLKVSPWKGVVRFEVPTHSMYQNLKKMLRDEPIVMPLEGIHGDDKLQFVEEPVEIMEREIKRLKRSRIPLVKVRWNSRRGPEFTWECEDSFKQNTTNSSTKRARHLLQGL
ncbi:hypothetical protein Tco_1281977 [Tanacetum coccineum]